MTRKAGIVNFCPGCGDELVFLQHRREDKKIFEYWECPRCEICFRKAAIEYQDLNRN